MSTASRAEPFRIEVAQSRLDDLKERLGRTRWPDTPSAVPWSLGADAGYMRALAARWADGYHWRAWERRFNALPNHRVTIDGQVLHYIVERGSGADPPR